MQSLYIIKTIGICITIVLISSIIINIKILLNIIMNIIHLINIGLNISVLIWILELKSRIPYRLLYQTPIVHSNILSIQNKKSRGCMCGVE